VEEELPTTAFQDQTLVHPVGLAALVLLAALGWVLPRRFAVLPIFLLASLIPSAHRIVVAGFDLSFLRILLIAAWLRLLVRGEARGLALNAVDRVFLAWVAVGAALYSARLHSFAALVGAAGNAVDALALYFLCRLVLRDWSDLARLAQCALLVSLPTALFFAIESQTGWNAFSVLGGVPEETVVREGRLRCQGAFQHPILAGIYWVTLVPLIAARGFDPAARRPAAVLGVAAVGLIVWACGSSTPVLGLAAVAGASLLFPIRFHLRWVRWGLVAVLVGLQIVMKAPVWHLISRVNVVGGSTGWHRFHLIDQFLRHFGEWWLIGTDSTLHWGYWMQDTTNAYVMQGIRGGLPTLALYVAFLALCFREVGLTLRAVDASRPRRAYAWALGLCVFAHCVVMLAASYFGQILIAFYLTGGAVASLRDIRAPAARRAERDAADAAAGLKPALAQASLAQRLRLRP
jgi:hypothetical protein